jgi:methylphosphotriester-DNA--protein-cysteine methyltransferase
MARSSPIPAGGSRKNAPHAFLRERARTETDPALSVVGSLVSAIAAASPGTRVSAIAAAHGISTRTMQRLFAAYVGVGPKWVLQRYRLHEAIEQLHAGPRVDWTRFALDLGYYDHAHFLRDFRALVGRSPAQYERETARLAHAA